MKRKFQSISVILMVTAAAMIMVACGGGGGGNSGPNIPVIEAPPADVMATLDQSNGESIMALSMYGQQVSGASGMSSAIIGLSAESAPDEPSGSLVWAVLDYIKAELAPPDLEYQPAGSGSGAIPCNGGSGSADLSWTGPQEVSSFCQIVNLSGRMVFKNCNIAGATATGTIDVSFTGPFCEPTAMYMDFTNVVMKMGRESMSTRSLDMDITNISWSRDMTDGGYMTNATIVVNGDAIGLSDGVDYAAVLDGFTQVMSTPNDRDLTIDISGNIYGTCLDGWAAIETITPIQVNTADDCPTAGEVVITGLDQATMTVVLEPNRVLIDDVEYPSCTALNLGCPLL